MSNNDSYIKNMTSTNSIEKIGNINLNARNMSNNIIKNENEKKNLSKDEEKYHPIHEYKNKKKIIIKRIKNENFGENKIKDIKKKIIKKNINPNINNNINICNNAKTEITNINKEKIEKNDTIKDEDNKIQGEQLVKQNEQKQYKNKSENNLNIAKLFKNVSVKGEKDDIKANVNTLDSLNHTKKIIYRNEQNISNEIKKDIVNEDFMQNKNKRIDKNLNKKLINENIKVINVPRKININNNNEKINDIKNKNINNYQKIKNNKNNVKKVDNINTKKSEENNNNSINLKIHSLQLTPKIIIKNKSDLINTKEEKNVIDLKSNNNKSRNSDNNTIINKKKYNDFIDKIQSKTIEQENKVIRKDNNTSQNSEKSFNPEDFRYLGILGEGEFSKIYLVEPRNNDNFYYSMKIETYNTREEVLKRQMATKIIKDFIKKTNSQGVIKVYGDIWKKNNNLYKYYVLMEKAERDMEKELIIRCNSLTFFTERDLINIITQLIIVCSQLQKNNIAHRDIKPQNILINNGLYKLSDFGEAIVFKKNGIILQNIRGTELFMSPVLFFGLKNKYEKVKHNAYKSDVFSLGLCILLAATLNYDSICQIREVTDKNQIKNVIMYFLSHRYSLNLISFLLTMLEIDENKRPDFIQLESMLVKKE